MQSLRAQVSLCHLMNKTMVRSSTMSISSEQELKGMQDAGAVVKDALAAMQEAVEPGVTTNELNAVCGRVFAKYGAVSAPFMIYGAPVNAFVSVNDAIVHGLPSGRKLLAGDVVKLDVTPFLNGYIADAARTVIVPPASKVAKRLVKCAEAAFWAAMKVTKVGSPLNAIGKTVEREVKRYGFSVVHDLAGHGVGRDIHEEPEVLNFYHPQLRQPLTKNLVIAVEPMVTAGRRYVVQRKDGWTVATQDGSLSAHYENTIVVQTGKPLVLTA